MCILDVSVANGSKRAIRFQAARARPNLEGGDEFDRLE
jgi:hypothetical protein